MQCFSKATLRVTGQVSTPPRASMYTWKFSSHSSHGIAGTPGVGKNAAGAATLPESVISFDRFAFHFVTKPSSLCLVTPAVLLILSTVPIVVNTLGLLPLYNNYRPRTCIFILYDSTLHESALSPITIVVLPEYYSSSVLYNIVLLNLNVKNFPCFSRLNRTLRACLLRSHVKSSCAADDTVVSECY